jgi:predicted GIY-YIG superfamily endonuclease
MPFVYMVRCADDSLYVGSTDNSDARIVMHNGGRGGRYTMKRRPVTLVFLEAHETADAARKRERQLKGWTAAKKEALAQGDNALLKHLGISHGSPRFDDDCR